MKRIFSGVQPTGDLHLGNYLGAIRQFVTLQKQADCLFCIVDMHAITVKHDPTVLAEQSLQIAAAYLACGLNPVAQPKRQLVGNSDLFTAQMEQLVTGVARPIIFIQSQVPAHAEMAWILGSVARMGWLERMVQFKDKAGENKERASVGLFTYPVLMAADILTYGATHVPVGDDQKQHLNLARDIAEKFNHDYGSHFPVPEAIHGANSRVMSLQDATKKMSKSDPDVRGRINFNDSDDVIRNKVRRATADTLPFPICDEEISKAEIENLISIYVAATGETRESVFQTFGGQGYGKFKPALADALIALVGPIRDKMNRLLSSDREYLIKVLDDGANDAEKISRDILDRTKDLIGFRRKGF
jgi:tryptophanyl-tRNA synthetase